MSLEKFNKAIKIFKQNEGILSTSKDQGLLESLSRGLYRLVEYPELSQPDLVIVAQKVPQAVICLTSALAFHEITTEISHKVDIAIPLKAHKPLIDYPPIQVFWYSEKNFQAGIELHEIDGIQVRIYSAEKTLADCFKYRNKIGLDVAMEALRLYWQRKKTNIGKILQYAKICRCENIIKPYLEMVAHD